MHSEVASIYFVVVAERPPELALDQPRHPYGRQGDEPGPIDVVVIGYPPGAPITGEAIPRFLDLLGGKRALVPESFR